MDIDKLLKTASDYLAQYAHDFVQTLRSPWPAATSSAPVLVAVEGGNMLADAPASTEEALSSRVWVFALLSIAIGFTLNQLAARAKGAELQQVVVYVAVSWLAFASLAFAVAKFVLRGTADFASTVRAILYALATTYVVASFASILASFWPPLVVKGTVYHWVPKATYLVVQGLLLAFLLGRNIRALNRFRGWKAACFYIVSPVPIVLINIAAGLAVYTDAWMADLLRK